MKVKRLEEIEDNDILAKPLMTWDYQIILQEGAVLKKEFISKLSSMGIEEVWVELSSQEQHKITILKQEVEKDVKEKVKSILERHTYHNNKELESLGQSASTIINSMLEEKELLEKVYDIKERTADIYEHSISVCALSILTAIKLGMNMETVQDMGVACLLHDIGLRYIAINYLDRNLEEMSEYERTEFKKHPVYGYSTLMAEKWISDKSKSIILNHHEYLNGTGFPLKTANLTIENRIVNVCDSFDEIICGVGFRKGKIHEAVEYLKVNSGNKYDSKIVEAFLSFTAVYPVGTSVLTSEGEIGLVIAQNKNFQDRPVLRITEDRYGNSVQGEVIKDMLKIPHLFIEKVL